MATNEVIALIVLIGLASAFRIEGEDCERDKSRIVREVIYQELLPSYKTTGAKIPYKCPFNKDRDRFLAHEEHKERESTARWACGYCGKVFIGEVYLDMHMANRHAATLYKEENAVCLADFCEIFRCEVLAGVAKATFWDVALCLEEDMQDLAQDCKDMMSDCIPDNLNWNASKTLTAAVTGSVCSFLTCKKFYEAPALEEKEPPRTSYVMLTVILCAAITIYYCVAVNYFWLDTFSDIYDTDEFVGQKPESLFDPDTMPRISQMGKPRRKTFIQSDTKKNREIFDMKKIEGLHTSVKQAQSMVEEHRRSAPVENVTSASVEQTEPLNGRAANTDTVQDHIPDQSFREGEPTLREGEQSFREGHSFSQLDNSVFVDER